MNFASLSDRRAAADPHRLAIADRRQSLTNAAFLHRVQAASAHMNSLGIGPDDVVALKLKNRVEFVVLLFAAWRGWAPL
jgi:long-chain acyl-CoA synthetase